MMESGQETKEMVMEFKYGVTVQNTKVIGRITKRMEKVNFDTWMEMNLKENGKTIKQTAMEFTFT